MTPEQIKTAFSRAGLSYADAARVLRVQRRSVIRWATGEQTPTGPALMVLEMLFADELPARYFTPQ